MATYFKSLAPYRDALASIIKACFFSYLYFPLVVFLYQLSKIQPFGPLPIHTFSPIAGLADFIITIPYTLVIGFFVWLLLAVPIVACRRWLGFMFQPRLAYVWGAFWGLGLGVSMIYLLSDGFSEIPPVDLLLLFLPYTAILGALSLGFFARRYPGGNPRLQEPVASAEE
jgi:hypothetical protein